MACLTHFIRTHTLSLSLPDPYKLLKVGPDQEIRGDPLTAVENELAPIKYVKVPGLPSFTGKVR